MESLKLSFEAVMPIFILMSLGYLLKILKVGDKKTFESMNKFVFRVFLPVLLFHNIYNADSAVIFDKGLVAFAIIGVICIFCVGYFAVLLITKDNSRRGVILQGFFRTNYAILGVPLVDYICGDSSTGLASVMVAVIIPVFNVFAVIGLERFKEGNINFKKLIKGIVTNPLIIGCLVGTFFLLTGIRFPRVIEVSIQDVAKTATPIAIIALGASFTFSSVKGYVKELVIIVASRLVVIPLVMLTAAVALGFRGEPLACILVIFGAPIAIASFSMAQQMGGDEKLAAQSIVISSALCLATLFGWIFALSSLGLV